MPKLEITNMVKVQNRDTNEHYPPCIVQAKDL